MLVTHLRCLAAATVAMLTVLAAPAVDAQPGALFTPVDETPPSGPLDDITLRRRVVMIDLGQLDHAQAAVAAPPGPPPHTSALSARTDTQRAAPAPGTTLTLNLFDDTVVTGLVEWTEPTFSGGYAVAGRLVDEPLGTLTLVVNGERVVGTVRLPEETYRLRSVGDGRSTISEVEEPHQVRQVFQAHLALVVHHELNRHLVPGAHGLSAAWAGAPASGWTRAVSPASPASTAQLRRLVRG